MATKMVASPAARVIEKCGGVDRVAKIVGRTPGSVYKWRWPKEKGGTGGLIPTDAQTKIWDAALRGEVDLTREDFLPEQIRGAA